MDYAIATRGLTKSFGRTRALDGLDLFVVPGEVHGFLGPNGSGKSTAIGVLLGLLRRDGGQVAVLGGDPWRDAVDLHRRIAYVPGDVQLWPTLSGGEAIDLLISLRGSTGGHRRDELIERFALDPTKRCAAYSKGNRQKVAIVAALAADADLYLLDEPTSGLDPLMEAVFQEVVREIRDRGRTVLLSSHILAEAEALCDRICIIRAGRIVESGTLAQLRHLATTQLRVTTAGPLDGLAALPGVSGVRLAPDGRGAVFDVEPDHLGGAVGYLAARGVLSLASAPPTLEELFLRHYGAEVPVRPDDAKVAA